jgi:hypothetical protein
MSEQNDRLLRSSRTGFPSTTAWAPETLRELKIPTVGSSTGYSGSGYYDPLVSRETISPVNAHPSVDQAAPFAPQSSQLGLDTAYEGKAAPDLRLSRSTIASWAFEILALTTSVVSIVAIVAVLNRENGKPITAWKFAFTINTIIATLGTIARTTLAFAMSACIGQQE